MIQNQHESPRRVAVLSAVVRSAGQPPLRQLRDLCVRARDRLLGRLEHDPAALDTAARRLLDDLDPPPPHAPPPEPDGRGGTIGPLGKLRRVAEELTAARRRLVGLDTAIWIERRRIRDLSAEYDALVAAIDQTRTADADAVSELIGCETDA